MTALGEMRSEIRDRLPDWVAGRLPDDEAARVAAVVEGDRDLEREVRLLRALRAAAPAPPEELADRIVAAARKQGDRSGGRRVAGSGVSLLVAAALVLAIGTVLVEWIGPSPTPSNGRFDGLHGPSFGEPSVVAGAPVLDELSDEELTVLLEELEG